MDNSKKIILDLCGGTGAWSRPYQENGYDVRNITLPEFDVRLYIPPKNVYGILSAPPCTHFASSGARWFKEKGEIKLMEGLTIVDACMRIILISKPKFWALENPVGRLSKFLGKPKMYFNPCDFGDACTKKTCLWGEFNIPIKKPVKPEFVVFKTKKGETKRMSKQHWNAFRLPKEKRSEVRSVTPRGFAQAFFEVNR
jgi:hypothetical protein